MSTGAERDDAEREALDALLGQPVSPPDVAILAAVQQGLESVPAGSPSGWYDVPRQRSRATQPHIRGRRPT
jgi:hypothetical protein